MESKEKNLMILKYGAYTFVIVLCFSVMLPLIGASMALSQNLMMVVLGAEIFFCCKEYKEKSEQSLDFKNAFFLGMKVSFVAGLINSILVLIIILAIGSAAIEEALYKSKALIYKGGDDAVFRQIVEVVSNPFTISIFTILLYLLIGVFLSILVALFVKESHSDQG
ncbi:MAG: DUF4199 domain-containing protein [Opitutaceae bacterium]|nr:DUF4199 domain-containing protein [Cytophagales bacterium]